MRYDVAVVGSGPSGAMAAQRLARAGMTVAILEKEQLPRYKTCGGGLVFRGLRLLDDIDLSTIIERKVFAATLTMLDSGLQFTVRREQPIVSMLMRSDFDRLLVSRAEAAGARLHTGFAVDALHIGGDGVSLCSGRRVIEAAFVIAADGAGSSVARLAGWPPFRNLAPALECELAVGADILERFCENARFDFDLPGNGYSWVFPKRDHLSVGVGRFGGRRGGNLHHALAQYLHMLGLPKVTREQVHGSVVPLAPRQGGFVRNGVFLVGDAAGVADPVSAEGISNAMRSGMMAAEALIDGGLDADISASLYQSKVEKVLLPELAAGRKLARIFYSSATIRGWLMRQHGERMVEAVVDIIMGDREFRDYADAFRRKLRVWQRSTSRES